MLEPGELEARTGVSHYFFLGSPPDKLKRTRPCPPAMRGVCCSGSASDPGEGGLTSKSFIIRTEMRFSNPWLCFDSERLLRVLRRKYEGNSLEISPFDVSWNGPIYVGFVIFSLLVFLKNQKSFEMCQISFNNLCIIVEFKPSFHFLLNIARSSLFTRTRIISMATDSLIPL